MKKGSNLGWQTSLADLSLILFMLSAAALHGRPPAKATPGPQVREAPASARSEPLAVYEVAPGAPPLDAWLQQQAADPRQQLTITVRYGHATNARAQALAEAGRLLDQAGAASRAARVVVEPGDGPARAVLAYDMPAGTNLARQAGSASSAQR